MDYFGFYSSSSFRLRVNVCVDCCCWCFLWCCVCFFFFWFSSHSPPVISLHANRPLWLNGDDGYHSSLSPSCWLCLLDVNWFIGQLYTATRKIHLVILPQNCNYLIFLNNNSFLFILLSWKNELEEPFSDLKLFEVDFSFKVEPSLISPLCSSLRCYCLNSQHSIHKMGTWRWTTWDPPKTRRKNVVHLLVPVIRCCMNCGTLRSRCHQRYSGEKPTAWWSTGLTAGLSQVPWGRGGRGASLCGASMLSLTVWSLVSPVMRLPKSVASWDRRRTRKCSSSQYLCVFHTPAEKQRESEFTHFTNESPSKRWTAPILLSDWSEHCWVFLRAFLDSREPTDGKISCKWAFYPLETPKNKCCSFCLPEL